MALKKIDYEYKAVNLLKGEQRSAEYLEVNPSGKVPALVIDGHTISESMAAIEYLEETRKDGVSLLPSDPFKRAQVRTLALRIITGIQPIQNLVVLQKLDESKRAEWGHHWIKAGFESLEKELRQLSGKYCLGDELTVADIALVPQVYNALRFKVDLNEFPTIKRLNEDLLKEDAFRVSAPDCQPDTPQA